MEQWKKDYLQSLGMGLFLSILLDQMKLTEGFFQQFMVVMGTATLLLVGDIRSRLCGRTEQ